MLFQSIQMAPNASELSIYHPFWVRTHFGCFKPWFGVIILLFYSFWPQIYSSDPWRLPDPLVPPWPLVCHPEPYPVILGHYGLYLIHMGRLIEVFHYCALQCIVVQIGNFCVFLHFFAFFVFLCMIWSFIIIFRRPEHRRHNLKPKWSDLFLSNFMYAFRNILN